MGFMQGNKGIIGKGDNALDPDKHFDVIALMLEPPASCCVWRDLQMEGEGVTLIADHAVNSFCNMLHRVFLYCLRVITSYPLSRVFHH
jgi:hypothetical protein